MGTETSRNLTVNHDTESPQIYYQPSHTIIKSFGKTTKIQAIPKQNSTADEPKISQISYHPPKILRRNTNQTGKSHKYRTKIGGILASLPQRREQAVASGDER
jgi:hypothetical protein